MPGARTKFVKKLERLQGLQVPLQGKCKKLLKNTMAPALNNSKYQLVIGRERNGDLGHQ
jgi:hypothetical protein